MESLFRYVAPPSQCGYLPAQLWSLEYELVAAMSAAEYNQRILEGWRHFGRMVFRPQCRACQACQSIRVAADAFRPNRSQRRARQRNEAEVQLVIGTPEVTRAKLRLYDAFHAFQASHKGWPEHPAKDAESYMQSFVDNPFPTQEWCYYLDRRLVGVGYVDMLPSGLSAIYFFYDPTERDRSLGTWNVLSILERCVRLGLPYAYLGYFVAGCASMAYKATFLPNEVLGTDGVWRTFRT